MGEGNEGISDTATDWDWEMSTALWVGSLGAGRMSPSLSPRTPRSEAKCCSGYAFEAVLQCKLTLQCIKRVKQEASQCVQASFSLLGT